MNCPGSLTYCLCNHPEILDRQTWSIQTDSRTWSLGKYGRPSRLMFQASRKLVQTDSSDCLDNQTYSLKVCYFQKVPNIGSEFPDFSRVKETYTAKQVIELRRQSGRQTVLAVLKAIFSFIPKFQRVRHGLCRRTDSLNTMQTDYLDG